MTKGPSRKRGKRPLRKAIPVRRQSAGALVRRATSDRGLGSLIERIVVAPAQVRRDRRMYLEAGQKLGLPTAALAQLDHALPPA